MEQNQLAKLTQDEIDELKEMLLESIYADIGRNVVRKLLWIAAAVISTLFLWLSSKHV